jgi:type VI secretion system protein ImpK
MPETPSGQRRTENLAFAFQELLTVGERLRSNRQQVQDAASFRTQLWAGVRMAEDDAKRRGYGSEDVELAVFAVVAFLDATILNLNSAAFAEWARQPMQEERYGHHVAGEIFFQNLQKLLARADSQELADLLEVYHLCLLLGFEGRYSLGGRGELRAVLSQTGEKLQRIRRTGAEFAPESGLPGKEVARAAGGDPWVLRLRIWAAVCAVLLVLAFAGFYFLLSSGVDSLRTLAGPVQ